MPSFSPVSLARLATCDQRLQDLFMRVIQERDCTVLEGFRGQAAQELAFEQGRSKKHWPDGKHNSEPSLAVDVAPSPLDWGNRERHIYFAGFVLGTAATMGIPIRWGGDWNGNFDPRDEGFSDLVHFEVVVRTPQGEPQPQASA